MDDMRKRKAFAQYIRKLQKIIVDRTQLILGKVNAEVNGLHIIENIESERGSYPKFYDSVSQTIAGRDQFLVSPLQARNSLHIIKLAMQKCLERKPIDYSINHLQQL